MILDNPFHVLGLLADASVPQRAGREGQIKAFLRAGRPLEFDDDLFFPGCRRNQGTVDRTLRDLHDAKDRIRFGLFWFTGSGGVLDDHALRVLRGGDLQGAISVWARVENRPLDARIASCLNNLGTACLLAGMTGLPPGHRWPDGSRERAKYVRRGLTVKARFVGSLGGTDLSAYCKTFGDDIAARDPEGIGELFGEGLEQFAEEARKFGLNIPAAVLAQAVKDGGPRTAPLAARFVGMSRRELEQALVACENAEPRDAGSSGTRLMMVAKERLPDVAAVLGETSIQYTSVADRVCDALVNAAVTHWNHYNDASAESSLEAGLKVARSCQSLVRYAKKVACGIAARERAGENLIAVDGIISDREMALVRFPIKEWLDQAYALLNSRARPQARIDFVQESLQERPDSATSIVNLLQELSSKGAAGFGPTFPLGEEVVECASVVCVALTGNVVSAHNDSPAGSSLERTATRLLHGVFRHFYPRSRPSSMFHLPPGPSTFPVKDEVFGNLSRNLAIAVEQGEGSTIEQRRDVREDAAQLVVEALTKTGKSLPPTIARPHVPTPPRPGHANRNPAPASARQGCLIVGLLLAGMAFALALASGDGSGPKPATDQEWLPSFLDDYDRERRGSGTPSQLEYTLPPVGATRLLSLPELRWCVRQEGTVEGVARELDDANQQLDHDRRNLALVEPGAFASEFQVENYNSEVDRYNRSVQAYEADRLRYNVQVEDYNGRCGRIRYRSGDLERARREVGLGGR
ncbi:MAG: hypothetical protein OXH66_07795 [Gemmatimonadetes bacterium]|nr:hypothetical protein [Gemmatimonadota bacterium]